MFAMGGQPVEMLGTVMDGMEAPEKFHAMLQPVSPVDEHVAQEHDFDGLQPPRLGCNGSAKSHRCDAVQPVTKIFQDCEHDRSPDEVLAKEKCKVGLPMGTENLLRFGREESFHRAKQNG